MLTGSINSPPWRALLLAALSLALAASFLPLSALYQSPGISDPPAPVEVDSGRLQVIVGAGRTTPAFLEAIPDSEQKFAIARADLTLDGGAYRYLRYRIEVPDPNTRIALVWQTQASEGLLTADLQPSHGGASLFNLGTLPDWQGTINGAGIFVVGNPESEPVRIYQLRFYPGDWRDWLRLVWHEWTRPETWSALSINTLEAAPTLSQTVAAASWMGLALVLLGIWRLLARRPVSTAAWLTALLLPWLAVDLLWQSRLDQQLEQTRTQFQGRSAAEKHLIDTDSTLYAYVQRLKRDLLPAEPARIFILRQSQGHDYLRLRAQYHLLPHNSFNYGYFPPRGKPRPGDFILVLDSIEALRYEGGALRWGAIGRVDATLLDSDPIGQLYRVNADQATAPATPRGSGA